MDDDELTYAVADHNDTFDSDELTTDMLSELWGYLQPCGPGPSRVLFPKAICRWSFGRKKDNNVNSVVLEALKISSQHCVITYQGNNVVTVLDMSSNGTWINGKKIGKGNSMELFNGNEICFGTTIPQSENGGVTDYRYIYRHTADGKSYGEFSDNFRLGFELGKGSFAAVHKATHKSTGRAFAVKVLTPNKLNRAFINQAAVKRAYDHINREINLMRKLEHPNICKFMQVYCDDNAIIYMILELVSGGDLLSLVKKRGRLEERHARDITYQICDALAYIHSQGIVHRDLKPENILVTDEDHPIAKVADFGIARVVDDVQMVWTMCGTPYYIAPELEDPNRLDGFDHKVDSWSMGVIVYGMLTGSQPFDIDDDENFKARIVDWATLATTPAVDRPALYFVSDLLEMDPRVRLSLSKAHRHYWLKEHQPYHRNIAALYRSAQEEDDQNEDDQNEDVGGPLRLDHSELADEPLAEDRVSPGSARARAPLQRRVTVLAAAQEGGPPVRQPSVEMIVNVSRRSWRNASAGPSRIATNANEGENSNKHSLTSIPEDASPSSSDDVEMVAASPVKTPRPARKKARVIFGSPRTANINRCRAEEDVHMLSPVKTLGPARSVASPKPIERRSSRIKKVNFRLH